MQESDNCGQKDRVLAATVVLFSNAHTISSFSPTIQPAFGIGHIFPSAAPQLEARQLWRASPVYTALCSLRLCLQEIVLSFRGVPGFAPAVSSWRSVGED